MPNSSPNHRALVAAVSFVLVQAASWGLTSVWGRDSGVAFAQAPPPKKEAGQSQDDSKTTDAQKNTDAQKSTEAQTGAEAQKAAAQHSAATEKNAGPVEEEKNGAESDVETARAIYISGDLGFTFSDVGLSAKDLGFDKTSAAGIVYGLSAGLRSKELRLGLRWRVHDTTEFALWSFAVSAGYGLPIRPLSPVLSAHLGYVFDRKVQPGLFRSSLPVGTIVTPDIDLKGILAGIDIHGSYWVTHFLRVGPFIGADLMLLFRAKVDQPPNIFGPQPQLDANPLYSDSGMSLGLNLNAGLRGAFDIGIQ